MAKSRITAVLILAASPAAAEPPAPDAARAIEIYRRVFTPVAEIDCPKQVEDEIVVCGRAAWEPDPNRPPIPYPPIPGERIRLVLGEAPRATLSSDACLPYQRCGNGGVSISINVFAIPRLIGKVIERVQDE
jgi:hypothetical protein